MSDPRTPPPPAALEDWVRRFGGVAPETEDAELVEGALRALGEALDRPGRDRRAAHALLAADALLTWACEDAARAADPEATLRVLLERLAEREPS